MGKVKSFARNKVKNILLSFVSLLSGLLNGFFGTGGGVPLWFAAVKEGDERRAFATTAAGVLILSLFSAFLYGKGVSPFAHVTPLFVFLSVVGGATGAALLGRVPTALLRHIFALLLILSGAYALGKGIQDAFTP